MVAEVTALLEVVYRQYVEWCRYRGIDQPVPKVTYKEQSFDITPQPTYAAENYGPRSLYPANWQTWSKHGMESLGRSPSPMSFSTHPGNSGAPTPPDLVSPSGSRCALDFATVERLIEERNEARRVCNFKEADRIRDLLKSHGIGLMDEPGARGKGKDVTSWRFGVRK